MFRREITNKAQTTTEYVIIIAIIAVVVSIAIGLFKDALIKYFNKTARVRTGTIGIGP